MLFEAIQSFKLSPAPGFDVVMDRLREEEYWDMLDLLVLSNGGW